MKKTLIWVTSSIILQKIHDFSVKYWFTHLNQNASLNADLFPARMFEILGYALIPVYIFVIHSIFSLKDSEEISPWLLTAICVQAYTNNQIGLIILIIFLVKIRFHLFPILRGSNPNS